MNRKLIGFVFLICFVLPSVAAAILDQGLNYNRFDDEVIILKPPIIFSI